MKLTPIFGLPIAEPDDARRDFPTQVDEPRTTKLEEQLAKARDTGWRNIASLLINGWTVGSDGYVHIRRCGASCFLAFHQLTVPATYNQYAITASPLGFGPSSIFYGSAYNSTSLTHHGIASVDPTAFLRFVGQQAAMGYTAGSLQRGSVVFATDAAWPETLPGIPV